MEIQMSPLEQRVLRFMREHHLISGQSKLVVAVSGGPDSVCLLHILVRLQQELGLALHVAHLNHQLRGAEADADARYVAGLAGQLDVPITLDKRNVKAYKTERRLSIEAAAREVRYDFLAEVAESIGADRVAAGHTVDDHVETILMHLIRGTGTRGLQGLRPTNLWQSHGRSLAIIRPLLVVNRQETVDYCNENRLFPRTDSSNLSLSPLRNRILHQLLPLLRDYNPKVDEALLRTAGIAGDELNFLDGEITRFRDEIIQKQGNAVILNRERFNGLPPALKRHFLRCSIEELMGNLKDIETRHIEGIMGVLDKPAGKRINLPDGLIFLIEYDKYLLGIDPVALSPFPVMEGEHSLEIPGETKVPGWQIEAVVIDPSVGEGKPEGAVAPSANTTPLPLVKGKGVKGLGLTDDGFTACFDFDKVGKGVTVRCRRRGDRFQPLGMSRTKKLGEFMIDAKIPGAWRSRIPLVRSPEQIIWVVGWRIDERAKVTEDTKQVLRLKIKRTDG